jgi:hypothetical protein
MGQDRQCSVCGSQYGEETRRIPDTLARCERLIARRQLRNQEAGSNGQRICLAFRSRGAGARDPPGTTPARKERPRKK